MLELSILAVAEHWHCDFEWLVHTEVAARLGIPQEAISAIQAGRRPEFGDRAEDTAYRFVTELLRTGSVGDEPFALARDLFGDDGTVELIVFAGHFSAVAFILNSFAVALAGPPPEFGHGAGQLHARQVDRRHDSLIRRASGAERGRPHRRAADALGCHPCHAAPADAG